MEIYKLKISFVDSRPTYAVTSDDGTTDQFLDFSNKPGAKIYLLMPDALDATVCYVGETTQSMQDRFRDGIRGEEKKRYKWIAEDKTYRLFVWNFEGIGGGSPLKSIEAELVFCVRVAQRAWPKNQTGINFHHLVDEHGRQHSPFIAMNLLSQTYADLENRANVLGRAEMADAYKNEAEVAIGLLKKLVFPA